MTAETFMPAPWLAGRLFVKVDLDADPNYDGDEEYRQVSSTVEGASLVSSLADDFTQMHLPVIDLDLPAALVPSSTPGHFHLYVDKPVTWSAYVKLLEAMADAGLVEQGYVNASIERGYTAVRLPWIKKGENT